MIFGTISIRRHFASHGAPVAKNARGDSGYTLVELLIYSGLLVLVLTVVGGTLLNTLSSEQKVLQSADANGVSQLIASSVHSGVRNATALKVFESTSADDNDQLLIVTSISSDPELTAAARVCQAWYYTEADKGAMYYKRSTESGAFVGVTTDTLAGDLTGWTLLGSGLSAAEASPGVSQLVFDDVTSGHPSVALNFAINADGDSSPAQISTTGTSRQSGTEATPCS
ncbi:hypothetical protein E3T39_09245 [Cryobacterium suzukii]|uniref:Uncharacterized protein n=1 Tax=Cryobacterium suzukii TaxID=1259198 RepID=A0A4R9AF83_9MICO|nr:hypothetical protein [Cryobacterium suzukii]TFD59861.1 hypothetical protein E3T39_09245 [Cryobacterium suzukii]